MQVHRTLALASAVALFLVAPGAAENAEAEEPALASIDRSLKQMVELLGIQVANQRAELAVKRLDIARQELVARERELHDAEAARDSLLQERKEIEARHRAFGPSTLDETDMSEEQREYVRTYNDVEAETIKQKIWRTDQRIADLTNALKRVQEDLDAWERLVTDSLVE